jgi:hypothetical protein
MADDKGILREVMESCLAVSQEATFQGFDDSVLKSEFADPKRRRLMEAIYRMGFESGWRVMEKLALHDEGTNHE